VCAGFGRKGERAIQMRVTRPGDRRQVREQLAKLLGSLVGDDELAGRLIEVRRGVQPAEPRFAGESGEPHESRRQLAGDVGRSVVGVDAEGSELGGVQFGHGDRPLGPWGTGR
jgi:hypothetical protein